MWTLEEAVHKSWAIQINYVKESSSYRIICDSPKGRFTVFDQELKKGLDELLSRLLP